MSWDDAWVGALHCPAGRPPATADSFSGSPSAPHFAETDQETYFHCKVKHKS